MYLECKYISHEELQLDITSFKFLALVPIVTDRMKNIFLSITPSMFPGTPVGHEASTVFGWTWIIVLCVSVLRRPPVCLLPKEVQTKCQGKGSSTWGLFSCFTIYPQLNHLKKDGGKESFEVIKWVLQLNHKSGTNIIFHVAIRTHCPDTLVQVLLCSVLGGTIPLTLQACSRWEELPSGLASLRTAHRGDQMAKAE